MPDPGPIKFPVRPSSAAPNLSLPRRRTSATRSPFHVSEASAAARESIKALVSATRAPFSRGAVAEPATIAEIERSLRQLELTLAERERLLAENEARLLERERDVAESEALLIAREQLVAATRQGAAQSRAAKWCFAGGARCARKTPRGD
jgi:hypothetical protein